MWANTSRRSSSESSCLSILCLPSILLLLSEFYNDSVCLRFYETTKAVLWITIDVEPFSACLFSSRKDLSLKHCKVDILLITGMLSPYATVVEKLFRDLDKDKVTMLKIERAGDVLADTVSLQRDGDAKGYNWTEIDGRQFFLIPAASQSGPVDSVVLQGPGTADVCRDARSGS